MILADTWFASSGSSSSAIAGGWIPTVPVLLAIGGYYTVTKKGFHATTNDAVQSDFLLLATAYVVLTITGVWFRGEGMVLRFPW